MVVIIQIRFLLFLNAFRQKIDNFIYRCPRSKYPGDTHFLQLRYVAFRDHPPQHHLYMLQVALPQRLKIYEM